jgi:hypothetical protein
MVILKDGKLVGWIDTPLSNCISQPVQPTPAIISPPAFINMFVSCDFLHANSDRVKTENRKRKTFMSIMLCGMTN